MESRFSQLFTAHQLAESNLMVI